MVDFTKEQFLAWARTKPADERFSFMNNNNCMMAQFLKEEMGWPKTLFVGGFHASKSGEPYKCDLEIPGWFRDAPSLPFAKTFGKAIERIEEYDEE